MQVISYTAARNELSKTMEKVCDEHSPVVITRANHSPVVMISLEDYSSMEETNYLMKSPANAKRLINSINEIETMISTNSKK